jgi:hypothetical protein
MSHLTADGRFKSGESECEAMLSNGIVSQVLDSIRYCTSTRVVDDATEKVPYLSSDALDPGAPPQITGYSRQREGGGRAAVARKKHSSRPKQPANCLIWTSALRSCLFRV